MLDNVIVQGVVPPSLEPLVVVVISPFLCKRHSGSPENVGMRGGGWAAGEEEGGESQAKRMFTKIIGFNLQSDTAAFIRPQMFPREIFLS